MRAAVKKVAELFPTAIISGRSRDKVLGFYFKFIVILFLFFIILYLYAHCGRAVHFNLFHIQFFRYMNL